MASVICDVRSVGTSTQTSRVRFSMSRTIEHRIAGHSRRSSWRCRSWKDFDVMRKTNSFPFTANARLAASESFKPYVSMPWSRVGCSQPTRKPRYVSTSILSPSTTRRHRARYQYKKSLGAVFPRPNRGPAPRRPPPDDPMEVSERAKNRGPKSAEAWQLDANDGRGDARRRTVRCRCLRTRQDRRQTWRQLADALKIGSPWRRTGKQSGPTSRPPERACMRRRRTWGAPECDRFESSEHRRQSARRRPTGPRPARLAAEDPPPGARTRSRSSLPNSVFGESERSGRVAPLESSDTWIGMASTCISPANGRLRSPSCGFALALPRPAISPDPHTTSSDPTRCAFISVKQRTELRIPSPANVPPVPPEEG
jgi:hypothetical protein